MAYRKLKGWRQSDAQGGEPKENARAYAVDEKQSGIDWMRLVVHRLNADGTGTWVVSEFGSGRMIPDSYGATRDKAVLAAIRKVNAYPTETDAAIRKAEVLHAEETA